MNKSTKELLSAFPQQYRQRRGPRSELVELKEIAEVLGLADAFDYLSILLDRPIASRDQTNEGSDNAIE